MTMAGIRRILVKQLTYDVFWLQRPLNLVMAWEQGVKEEYARGMPRFGARGMPKIYKTAIKTTAESWDSIVVLTWRQECE